MVVALGLWLGTWAVASMRPLLAPPAALAAMPPLPCTAALVWFPLPHFPAFPRSRMPTLPLQPALSPPPHLPPAAAGRRRSAGARWARWRPRCRAA